MMPTAGPALSPQAAPGSRRLAAWPRVAVEVRQVRGPNKPPPGSPPGQLLLGLRRKRVLLAAVLGLALTGCSDGKSAAPTSRAIGSTSADLSQGGTTTTPNRTQLAAMMPTMKEFGLRQWVDMQPAERVEGQLDNRRASRDSVLWNLTPPDLDAMGRVTGYHRYFWNGGCGGACSEALLEVAAEVHVFRDAQAASRFLKTRAKFYRNHDGKPVGIYRVAFFEQFPPGPIGEEAVGFRDVLKGRKGFPGDAWRGTVVLFRVDRIIGVADAASLNQENPAARAVAVAGVLETRITDVLKTGG